MIDEDQVLKALAYTYTAQIREERQKAQDFLSSLRLQKNFFQYMGRLLLRQDLDKSVKNMKGCRKAIANYMQKYIQLLFDNALNDKTQTKKKVLSEIVGILSLPSLQRQVRKDVVGILSKFLLLDRGVHNFSQDLIGIAKQLLNSEQLLQSTSILQAVLLGPKEIKIRTDIYLNCFDSLVILAQKPVNELEIMLSKTAPEILPNLHTVGLYNELINTLQSTLLVLFYEIDGLEFDKYRSTFGKMVRNTRLFAFLTRILMIAPPCYANFLILPTDQTFHRINHIRTTITKTLYKVLLQVRDNKMKLQELKHLNDIYVLLVNKMLLELPDQLNKRKVVFQQFEQFENNYPDTLLEHYLLTMSVCIRHIEWHDFFVGKRTEIFHRIILKILQPDRHIQELLNIAPLDYLRTLVDFLDKNLEGSVRASSAKILQSFYDRVDGSVTFVVNQVLKIIDRNSQMIRGIRTRMQTNSEFQNSSPAYQLEVAINLLSHMSYIGDKRPDLISTLQQLLDRQVDLFTDPRWLQEHPAFIISFILFYQYYSDVLFVQPELTKTLQKIILWLVQLSRLKSGPIAELRKEVYDALAEICCEPELAKAMKIHCLSLIQELLPNMKLSCCHELISLIGEVMLSFSRSISVQRERVIHILTMIGRQAYVSEESTKMQPQKDMLVDRYLHLLKSLVDCKEYYPYLDDICMAMQPCMKLLKCRSTHHNNILAIFNSTVKATKVCRPEIALILEAAPQIIEWNHGSLLQLFQTFNLSCIYLEQEQRIQVFLLFKIILNCLSTMSEQTVQNDLVQGCLLMHTFLYYHGEALQKQLRAELIGRILRIIDTHHTILSHDIYGKYLLILLRLLQIHPGIFQGCLPNQQVRTQVLALLYSSKVPYTNDPYDAKVFCICQVGILQKLWLHLDDQLLLETFQMLLEVIKYLFQQTTQQRNQPSMGYGQQLLDDATSSDNMSEESDNDLVESYKATMKLVVSPYKQLDEFQLFRSFVEKTNKTEGCYQRLRLVVQRLQQKNKEFLAMVVRNVQKIYQPGVGLKPRRIVKIKRN